MHILPIFKDYEVTPIMKSVFIINCVPLSSSASGQNRLVNGKDGCPLPDETVVQSRDGIKRGVLFVETQDAAACDTELPDGLDSVTPKSVWERTTLAMVNKLESRNRVLKCW